ncbi:hypothetical protein EYF80_030038 [Liparis tanakae]|uniref:Uncharacterized protein n=1 Tax=Liparis tanakae TaxID=230148 RepID=A0A4Z2H389_9TELE|nr:hypothetical protein EYF80_030038 [Liparis tanakae]
MRSVTVLAVGIEQANTEELRRAVTDGSPQNILYTRDAAQLDAVHTDLAELLCGIARIPDVGPGPEPCTTQCPQKHPNVFFKSKIFPIYFRERGDIVEKRVREAETVQTGVRAIQVGLVSLGGKAPEVLKDAQVHRAKSSPLTPRWGGKEKRGRE